MEPLRKVPGALPFFIAAFLNAFVDLGHKIVIQNTVYKLYDGPEQVILTAIVNALILLPFLLLLSPAGFFSDKLYKSHVMRLSAWAAVVLTLAITACYYLGWFKVAFVMTFLLAAQSALYSPAKYGYIKELFGKERLSEANGVVSALSITAILAGSFAFTIFFEALYPKGATQEAEVLRAIAPVGWLLVLHSIIELVAMYRLPNVGRPDPQAKFETQAFMSGRLFAKDLQPLRHNRAIILSVLGLAMFWSIGQVLLAAFPSFLKQTTGELNTLKVQAVLACSGVGIALGSMIAGKVSRNYIELGLLPVGALGILGGLAVLTYLDNLIAFGLCFLVIGMSGGIFIVPLNALIQFNAKGDALGKTLAANNWVQNLAMLIFLMITAVFAHLSLSSELLLKLMVIVALVGCIFTLKQLPQAFVRFALASAISRRYKVSVQGMRHIPASGGILLLGNHISWIDWAILQLACPRPVRFVMIKNIYQRWYLKRFLDLMGCIPIAQGASAQSSLERVAKYLNQGEVVCLFPEGTISRTGHLAEFRRGFERAAALCDERVQIIPFYLRGLWGSQFSRAGEQVRRSRKKSLTRQLICAFGQPMSKETTAEALKQEVYDLSLIAWQTHIESESSLGASWIERAKQVGPNALIIKPDGSYVSGYGALAQSLIWARRLRLQKPKTIAMMLPPSGDAAILHMAAFVAAKSVVNVDPQLHPDRVLKQLLTLNVDKVYVTGEVTGETEAQRNNNAELANELAKSVKLVDVMRLQASTAEQWMTYCYVRVMPTWKLKWLSLNTCSADATAVTVFTESHGVNLSHKNIQANIAQITDVLNATNDDVVLTQLPIYQAYGLTVGLLMPLLQGIPCAPQASDDAFTHAQTISRHDITLVFANKITLERFLAHNKIHTLMLKSLRTVVASYLTYTDGNVTVLASDLIHRFQLKYTTPVRVGFGITEASPVVSCNIPDAIDSHNWKIQKGEKPHSQGMPLPGTSLKIVDADQQFLPSCIPGTLWVAGPQVMQGYLSSFASGNQESPIHEIDGVRWLDTGLPALLDEDGFLVLQLDKLMS